MTQFSESTRKQIASVCKKYKIRDLSLFGSRVRGEASDRSDYDLLVDFWPDSAISLFEFSRIQVDLEDILGTKVDLVPKSGLKPLIRNRVLAEAMPIYEE